MKRTSMLVVTLLLTIIFLFASIGLASAESPCPGVEIRNETQNVLDNNSICNAAKPWIDKGFQIFIFLTNEDPRSEDEWFTVLDRVESDWGIYIPSEGFSKSAVAFEATTVTDYPWGHNITHGDNLLGTPLDSDSERGKIKGQLKNTIASADYTGAFVTALTNSYSVAFPAPIVQPTVIRVEAPKTEVNVDFRPALAFLGKFLGILFLIIAGAFVTVKYLIPLGKQIASVQRKKQHLDDVAKKVENLIAIAGEMFEGTNYSDTDIWRLFKLYESDKYPELAREVQTWITQSQQALDEAVKALEDLDHLDPGEKHRALNDLIKAYEELYTLLVGTDPQILSLSEEGLRSFLDPMAPGLTEPQRDQELVSMIRNIRSRVSGQTLRVDFMFFKPTGGRTGVYATGVFGYANKIKQAVQQVIDAERNGPTVLKKAEALRNQLNGQKFPKNFPKEKLLSRLDAKLKETHISAQEGKWLIVVQLANDLETLARNINQILPSIIQAYVNYTRGLEKAEAISKKGYKLEFLVTSRVECLNILNSLMDRLSQGLINDTQRSIENLNNETTSMLAKAESLVSLKEANDKGLMDLSIAVAKTETFRGQVEVLWKELQKYPESNYRDIREYFQSASATLKSLFDEPGNPKDLASTVERLNSLGFQEFKLAEQKLKEANSSLDQIRQQLDAIKQRYDEIQKIKSSIEASFKSVENEINKARERRDKDNKKVDSVVDQQIREAQNVLDQARSLALKHEFYQAEKLILWAKELAINAYASADTQAKEIDKLLSDLLAMKNQVEFEVKRALTNQNQLTPAAQNAATAGLCNEALTLLKKATSNELEIGNKEDRALAKSLKDTITLYKQALSLAIQALQKIEQNKRDYEGWISSARDAVSSAEDAITSASRYVNDSDANNAGLTSLSQAESELPDIPAYGAVAEEFRRTARGAQQAEEYANQARAQAQRKIEEVEAERRRREAEERRRREAEEEAERARRRAMEAASYSRSSSSYSSSFSRSSSFGSSSRPSSFSSRSSSSSFGGRHR